MPRRPSHLAQDDGPLARFALELRALRDAAGFDAPSVDQIAARTNIPRSTLFAALRGQRLPTRPVLGALVTAWGVMRRSGSSGAPRLKQNYKQLAPLVLAHRTPRRLQSQKPHRRDRRQTR
ncbi:helix-turn-helix domain-containing protein [Streptomyces olivaceus]|uniref:helix-turn-helix domain-containing protein n=1 Tax=Streptomyces olivaceus TaxID=47716 RepID=UPI0036AEE119